MTKEEKAKAKEESEKEPGANKFIVGDVVRHKTPAIELVATVKSLAWRRRPGTKSDTEWHYELDASVLNGVCVPESTLTKK